jgi:hypothetical protein
MIVAGRRGDRKELSPLAAYRSPRSPLPYLWRISMNIQKLKQVALTYTADIQGAIYGLTKQAEYMKEEDPTDKTSEELVDIARILIEAFKRLKKLASET